MNVLYISKIGAVTFLGEPIKQKGFRLGDSNNFLTTEQAQFQVNVEGPNDKGSNKNSEQNLTNLNFILKYGVFVE